MTRRKTKRYNLPRIDLNGVKLPKVDLPKINLPASNLKIPAIHIPWKQVIVVVVMVVLALTMLNLNTRLSEYSRLSRERDTLSTQVGGLRATKMALETQLAYVGSGPAIIAGARDAHMVREGEKLMIVMTPANNVVSTPQVDEEKVTAPQPWEIWLALFFGN